MVGSNSAGGVAASPRVSSAPYSQLAGANLRVYVDYCNRERPHRSLDLNAPMVDGSAPGRRASHGDIQRRDRLGGLVHEYYKATARVATSIMAPFRATATSSRSRASTRRTTTRQARACSSKNSPAASCASCRPRSYASTASSTSCNCSSTRSPAGPGPGSFPEGAAPQMLCSCGARSPPTESPTWPTRRRRRRGLDAAAPGAPSPPMSHPDDGSLTRTPPTP
jgi:hypothetical protein